MEYLEAVLTEDEEQINQIETKAELAGYGPRAICHTIVNNGSQRLNCCKYTSLSNSPSFLNRSLSLESSRPLRRKIEAAQIDQTFLQLHFP